MPSKKPFFFNFLAITTSKICLIIAHIHKKTSEFYNTDPVLNRKNIKIYTFYIAKKAKWVKKHLNLYGKLIIIVIMFE